MGAPIAPPRKRGRPKGSTNKRAADLKGFIAARYGGSAAQQSAAICMVTAAELKAAGGSMAKAQVNKALDLVKHVRAAQENRDEWLRELVRRELADLAEELPAEVVKAVKASMRRISEATAGFGLREALAMLTSERAALLPYTDQRQPLAVEKVGDGWRPDVVFMGAAPVQQLDGPSADLAGEFRVIGREVSQPMSHEEGQPPDCLGLLPLAAADGK